MTPDHIQVRGRKILFTPVARGGDDGLMFSDHVLEFLDHLECDFVFGVTEIYERTRVGAPLRKDDLDRRFRIQRNRFGGFFAADVPANQNDGGKKGSDCAPKSHRNREGLTRP